MAQDRITKEVRQLQLSVGQLITFLAIAFIAGSMFMMKYGNQSASAATTQPTTAEVPKAPAAP